MQSKQTQKQMILRAEKELGVGPVHLARQLRTPYHTLKDWKNGRSVMPGVAWAAIDLLINAKQAS